MEEFRQVLPALARSQIQVLLRELRKEQTIHSVGLTKGARWFPGPASANCNSDEPSS
jgi:ATP-dependent DNA helicase RecG